MLIPAAGIVDVRITLKSKFVDNEVYTLLPGLGSVLKSIFASVTGGGSGVVPPLFFFLHEIERLSTIIRGNNNRNEFIVQFGLDY